MLKVKKFGGTSVGNPEAIQKVLAILGEESEANIYVFSAFSGLTDTLVELCDKIPRSQKFWILDFIEQQFKPEILNMMTLSIPEGENRDACSAEIQALLEELKTILMGLAVLGSCTIQSQDTVLSFGERLSSKIIYYAAKSLQLKVQWIDITQFLKTDNNYGQASLLFEKSRQRLQSWNDILDNGYSIITQGFIAKDNMNRITTFGRGGSDYTASLLGKIFSAEQVEIWTDVDGILSIDPNYIKDAYSIKEIQFETARLLAYFGSKVLHPATMIPAIESNIPIVIRNTFNPEHPGTKINPAENTNSHACIISVMKNIAKKESKTEVKHSSDIILHSGMASLTLSWHQEKKETNLALVTLVSDKNAALIRDSRVPTFFSILHKQHIPFELISGYHSAALSFVIPKQSLNTTLENMHLLFKENI